MEGPGRASVEGPVGGPQWWASVKGPSGGPQWRAPVEGPSAQQLGDLQEAGEGSRAGLKEVLGAQFSAGWGNVCL